MISGYIRENLCRAVRKRLEDEARYEEKVEIVRNIIRDTAIKCCTKEELEFFNLVTPEIRFKQRSVLLYSDDAKRLKLFGEKSEYYNSSCWWRLEIEFKDELPDYTGAYLATDIDSFKQPLKNAILELLEAKTKIEYKIFRLGEFLKLSELTVKKLKYIYPELYEVYKSA